MMKNFKCLICDEEFSDFNSMWKHLINKHKAYSNTCEFCLVNLSNFKVSKLKHELGLYIDLEVFKDIDEVKYNNYFLVGAYINRSSEDFSELMKSLKKIRIITEKLGIDSNTLVLRGVYNIEEHYSDSLVLLFEKNISDKEYFKLLSELIRLSNDDESINELKNRMNDSINNSLDTRDSLEDFVKGYNYTCPLCGAVFNDESLLKNHLREFHNVDDVDELLQLMGYKNPILSREAIEKIGLFKNEILDTMYKLNIDGSIRFTNTYGLNYELIVKVNTPTLTLAKFEEILKTVFIGGYKHFGKIIIEFKLDGVVVKCNETFIKFTLGFKE